MRAYHVHTGWVVYRTMCSESQLLMNKKINSSVQELSDVLTISNCNFLSSQFVFRCLQLAMKTNFYRFTHKQDCPTVCGPLSNHEPVIFTIPVFFIPGPRGPLPCMFQMFPCHNTLESNDQLVIKLCLSLLKTHSFESGGLGKGTSKTCRAGGRWGWGLKTTVSYPKCVLYMVAIFRTH